MVTISIEINGNVLSENFKVESIEVKKEINNVPWAKVVINNEIQEPLSFELNDQELLVPGNEVEIKAGYNQRNATIFKGIIIKHSVNLSSDGLPKLILECYDKAIKMTVGRKSKVFTEMNDSDVIGEIVNQYDLSLNLQLTSTFALHNKLVQYNCTDWDFVLARADTNGMLCIPNDGDFIVQNPQLEERPVVKLVYGSNILNFDAEIDARHQISKVISKSWNYSNQEIETREGHDPYVSLNSKLKSSELADVIGLESYVLEHGGKLNTEELQAWSDSLILKRQLAKARGTIRITGARNINPGNIVLVKGLGSFFSGNAFVSGVHHFIADGDWQMDIKIGADPQWFTEKKEISERPASGLVAAFRGLQVGIVDKIEADPDGEERVCIQLPVIENSDDGIWARVATLDAGNDRGVFFRPEIGDEVIVGFVNDDPRDPVILGMMNSSAKPAPLVAQNDNPQKGFVTRSKLKLIFDDEEKKVLIETPAGKKVVLSEDQDDITLSDEHQNKFVMDKNGILIESQKNITISANHDIFIEGANTEMNAQLSAKISGSSEAKLETGGMASVIGSLVKIN